MILGRQRNKSSRVLLCLGTLLFLGAVGDVLAAVDFPTATDFELTSDTPKDISLADFNGDGDLDIAVALSGAAGGDAGISVVVTDGLGGFDQDQPFSPGFGAHALAAGDLNGDTFMDLAVAGIFGSGSTAQVRLFLGNGAGVFTAATPSNILSAAGFPSAIVVGNFNGDTNPDIAVADSIGGVLVYLGNGTIGTGSGFDAAQTITGSSQSPLDLILDDFNSDGNIDLATPSAVFLGAGNGTFSVAASLGGGRSLASGDVNGDGALDITVNRKLSGSEVLETWFGAGDGTFSFGVRTTLLGTAHINVRLAVADMDADGTVDVVASDPAGNTVKVLPGQGDGSFGAAQSFATPAFSGPVAIGDWNRDGLPDMASGYGTVDAAGLSVFFQTQPGPASAAPGAFRLGNSSYAVTEGIGQALISVVRTGSSAGATAVNFTTADDTATAGQDYTTTSGTLNFADGQVVASFPVTILDDTDYEGPGTESLTVSLNTPTAGATLGTPSSASIVISENDPVPATGSLQFSATTYDGLENSASVTVTVTRTGGSVGVATANYATANGTATATEDYTATSGMVTFADGSTTSQTFTVPLVDDSVYEGDETVFLSLTNVTGATAGSPTSATLTITENDPLPSNDPPVAVDNSYNATEDTTLTIIAPGVLGNDTDADSDPLTAVIDVGPGDGGLTLNADGSFTYTPNGNFNGSDSFTYHANDGQDDSNIATVSITVAAANDTPIAVDDSDSTAEDTAVTVDVLTNDSDPDGDTITVSAVSQGANGAVTFTGTNVTYTPDTNFNGNDSFTYTITDSLLTATATVSITVGAANDAPIAVDDSDNTAEDTAVTVNVLTNDSDPDNDTITVSAVSQGTNGTVTFTGTNVTYTPDTNFNGNDSFTYTITDSLLTATAMVSITVGAANDAPIAVDDSDSTAEDTAVTVSVLANDSDPDNDTITVSAVSQGTNGTVTFTGNNVTYTPNSNFNGNDSFTYTITDSLLTATANVSISVGVANDAPIAVNDSDSTAEDTAVTVSVLANDSDPDGDTITVSGVGPATNGTVTFTGTNVTYTPNSNFNGNDSFTYTITDSLLTATATVSITVGAANDAPIAVDDSGNTAEDTAVTVSVLANDSDPDNDTITVSAVSQGTNGTVTFTGNSATYTPNSNFNGNDSFTYTITDSLLTATATVSISVGAANDAPIAVDDSDSTAEDTAVTVSVLANDSDPDGDTITVSAVSQGTDGTVTFTGSNVTYTPNSNFNGNDNFTYTITDSLLTATATVSISVGAANDAPVAVDDPATTDEDQAVIIDVLANDSDPDGDTLSISAVTQGVSGQVINNGNNISYSPDLNFHGIDTFTYTVTDGTAFATASVSVDVIPVNDIPVAVDDSETTIQGTSVTIDVMANDSDGDNDAISLTAVTQGTNGSVQIIAGEVVYTPNIDFTGADSFDYTITDGLATASATVTVDVLSPPGGTFSFEFADYSIGESGWEITLNVVRSGGTLGVISVDYDSTDGSATAGLDYDPTIGTLTFADGEAIAAITVPILDDAVFEGDEIFSMTLGNVQGAALLGAPSIASITILDDDPQPTAGELNYLVSSVDVLEGAGSATLTVVRSGGSLGQVSVDFVTIGGTAAAVDDYDHTTGTVIFDDGQTGNKLIQVVINDDGIYEGDESFTVSLLNVLGGAVLTAPNSAVVNIMDDDPAPPVGAFEFGAAQYSASEDSGNLIVEISRIGGSFGTASIDFQSTNGTAVAPQDYTAVSGTVEFLDGESSHTVSIPIFDDIDYEGDEDFTLAIQNPTGGATLGTLTTTTATILENESPPSAGVLQFSGAGYTVIEDAVNALVTVTRSGGSSGAVSIDYATSDDSAIAGQDYQSAVGTLMFADGDNNKMIVIPILDDAVFEATERFQIALSNPQGGAQLGLSVIADVVIEDDEPPPSSGTIEFSAVQYSSAENTPISTITVIRAGGSTGQVGVEYSSTDGTASAASDYTAVANTLMFADGETIRTFDIAIIDDASYEGDETVFLSLANASGGAGLGGQTTATLTIQDNEIRSPGAVKFEDQAYSVTEGGSLTITIVRTGGSDGQIGVELNSVDGTARAGSDYNAISTVLLFADGEISKVVTLVSIDDTVVESTENLKLDLSNPSGGATISVPADATITITDNDRATPPTKRRGGGSTGLWWLMFLMLMSWNRLAAGRLRFYLT